MKEVLVNGGLVPTMLDELQDSGFRQRFEYKGGFLPPMARVPSVAVLHRHPGLPGAAAIARQQLQRGDSG